ncbi:MAG: zeta toxin family protein [Alphaproteobacteria bacterium]|nr:zeta toxin family protein [Alphaproteobacteria bacterium]
MTNELPEQTPKLIFVAGATGSGKSRLLKHAKKLSGAPDDSHVISFNDFKDIATHHMPVSHSEKSGANLQGFLDAREKVFSEALDSGKTIIFETHCENREQLVDFVGRAKERGYTVEAYGVIRDIEGYLERRLAKGKKYIADVIPNQLSFIRNWEYFRLFPDKSICFEAHDGAPKYVTLHETVRDGEDVRLYHHDLPRWERLVDGWSEDLSKSEPFYPTSNEIPHTRLVEVNSREAMLSGGRGKS